MKKNTKKMALRPHVTEKGMQAQTLRQYIFKVSCQESKKSIQKQVEENFKVKVIAVNTIKMEGKVRRLGKITGRRKNWKKAYVTLAEGHVIDTHNENPKE